MNTTYINIWDSLAVSLEIYFFYTCFLHCRRNFRVIPRYLSVTGLAVAGYLISRVIPAAGAPFFLFQIVLVLFIIFAGKISKKITTAVLLFLSFLIIESLTLALFSFNYDLRVINDVGSELYRTLFTPAQHLNMTILIIILRRLLKDRKFQSAGYYYLIQMIIPALSITAIIYLFQSDTEAATVRFLTYVLLLINVAAYLMSRLNERLYHMNTVQQMEKQLLEQKESYYEQLDEYQQEIRMIRHDFKNTLLMISPHIADETVRREVGIMLDHPGEIEHSIVFSSHMGLNALLNEKVQYAKQKGIQCNFDIFVPQKMNVSDNDIGIIVGNLLNNAIEAIGNKAKEKYINLSMIYYNQSLSVVIENPLEADVTDLNTSKADIKNHGLGTKSIEKTVEKYHGTYEWQGTGKLFRATVLIWDQRAD